VLWPSLSPLRPMCQARGLLYDHKSLPGMPDNSNAVDDEPPASIPTKISNTKLKAARNQGLSKMHVHARVGRQTEIADAFCCATHLQIDVNGNRSTQ
jgi:hypothetical protein